jgi:hypothetical protein
MKAYVLGAALVGLLAGCAQNLWNKPGASKDDFASDRYECLQGSQQQTGTAFFNRYGGASSSGMATNGGIFDACMNARGWTLTRVQNGPGGTSIPPSNPLADTGKALQAEALAMCARPDMQRIVQKSACQAKEITLEQLADESFLAAQDKPLFSAWRAEVAGFNAKFLTALRTHGGAKGSAIATSDETVSARLDQASLALYTGKSTWGQYNQQRKDIARAQAEEASKILTAR